MFKNQVGEVVTELALAKKIPNITGKLKDISCWGTTTIEYISAPSDSLSKLVRVFGTIDDDNVSRGLRFSHIHMTCKSLLVDSYFELYLNCNGHYVAGSYVHDYTAAEDYVVYLNDKYAPFHFEWLKCESSNSHLYSFKTIIDMSKLDKHIDTIVDRVATKGLYKR